MKKSIFSLLSILFLFPFCYAIDNSNLKKSNIYDQQENDSNAKESKLEADEVAQGDRNVSPTNNARWYKSREGRREYLKGGSDHPRKSDQFDESNSDNAAPKSDSRWYKSREGRQEYRQGASDYPSGQ